jgi:site-specific DNA recombinase
MNALKPRPPFQVLVMSEESRLGREQIKTAYALKQIMDAGVRVFFYLEDRERTLDSAMDKVMLSLTNFAAEMEREKARQRTYDAMQRKAAARQVAGGIVYGYDNVEVLSTTPGTDGRAQRLQVLRRINEAQAELIRRIFQLTADGWGLVRTAKQLNTEGIVGPRRTRLPDPTTGRLRPTWSPSSIREMLRRDLYRGVITWNRTRRVDRGGTRKKIDRPRAEWIPFDAPELRIIDEALWSAVERRLEEKQASYVRGAGGQLWGRPERSLDSPYLLTGFARCALCGGSLFVRKRTSRGGAWTYYGCMYNHQRGPAACANTLTVPMDRANGAFLDTLRESVLTPRVVQRVVGRALELATAVSEDPESRRQPIQEELRQLDVEIARYTDAVGRGEPIPSLLEALRVRERRRRELQAQIQELEGMARLVEGSETLVGELGAKLTDWQGLLERQPIQARQLLRKLLVGRLIYTPHRDEAGGYYEFTGTASFGRLLSGTTAGQLRWCPRG